MKASRSIRLACMFNGDKIDGPVALREMLTAKPDMFAGVLHREADDVRAGPRNPILRHAGDSRRFCAMPAATITAFRRSY